MVRAFLTVLLTVTLLSMSPGWAQNDTAPNYDRWGQVATQAETLVGNADTPTRQLETIRDDIVTWRGRFQAAQNVNADRIAAVEAQISALGPAPAEGATEPADIAGRRADLQGQLSELQAPRLTAVEAFSRADGIVRQINETLAQRNASQMVQQSTSPLLPENWLLAASEARQLVGGIVDNTRQRIAERATWAELQPRLPYVLGYLLTAILLLTLGRHWVETLPQRISARTSDYARAAVTFVVSLLQIALPMAGIYLLINALTATGIFGPWTLPFLNALPGAGVILFGSAWLTRQLFPSKAINYDTLVMSAPDRQQARWLVHGIGLVFAVHFIASHAFLPLSGLIERSRSLQRVPLDFSDGAAAVVNFVLIVIAAALLFQLGSVLRRLNSNPPADLTYRHRVLAWAGIATRILAVIAVLISAAGFINLGNVATWPWVQTLALLGLLVLLQDFSADVYNMFKRGQEGARDGLAPLLTGFALIVLSVPLFMLVWGVSVNELGEYWIRFQQGVTMGGIRLSPGAVLMFILVFAIGYTVTRGVQGAMRKTVLPKTRLDPGGQNAVVSGIGYVGIVLAAMLAISSAGIDLSSFAIVAGALSVGIGFGLQNIVSNFVSGIILLIERPVSVGDWISAGGQQGIVKRISVRSTQVETFDKQQVIVPNSDLISQPVINWTRQSKTGRIIIPIGVSYGADTRKVQKILKEIIEDQPLVTIDPAPIVLLRGITVDFLNFEIRAVISDIGSGLSVTSEVYHQIIDRFLREGIGMPFTPRDVWKDGDDLPHPDQADQGVPPMAQSNQPDLPDDGK